MLISYVLILMLVDKLKKHTNILKLHYFGNCFINQLLQSDSTTFSPFQERKVLKMETYVEENAS